MRERCVLFVACTRARDHLYVSGTGKLSTFLPPRPPDLPLPSDARPAGPALSHHARPARRAGGPGAPARAEDLSGRTERGVTLAPSLAVPAPC